MKKYIYISLSLFVAASVLSCSTIHKFPEDTSDGTVLVTFNAYVDDANADLIETEDYPIEVASDQSMRLILEAYDYNDSETLVLRKEVVVDDYSINEDQISFQLALEPNKYLVSVWMSYVDDNTTTEKYYTTADGLKKIELITPLIGDTDDKDCFFSSLDVDLTPYVDKKNIELAVPVPVARPVAKYCLIANDTYDYVLNTEPDVSFGDDITLDDVAKYTAEISYNGYTPNGLNAFTGELNNAVTGLSYTSKIQINELGEAVIAIDYAFAKSLEQSATGTSLSLTVRILDENGEYVNEQSDADFTVVRGCLTIYRSDFFTREKVSGGVSVDQDFDGEYDIQV
ncbi:MAG: DUF6562 domain-containing protein [Rikenellaceae bacterium]